VRIVLGTLSQQKQRTLLDYFNAGLRATGAATTARGESFPDGGYSVVLAGPFPVGEGTVDLAWKLDWLPDGTLPHIEVVPRDPELGEKVWGAAVAAFIEEVRHAVLAERISTFSRRAAFHYIGFNLDGEYRLPGFRLAPADPSDNVDVSGFLPGEERVLLIDQQLEAIDATHADRLAEERAARTAARLSLLLDLGLYRPPAEMRWVHVRGADGETRSERRRLGFVPTAPTEKEDAKPGRYVGTLSKPILGFCPFLRVPEDLPTILSGIDESGQKYRDAFDACARLYQVARVAGRMYPSLGLAYRVAAAEAIAKRTGEYNRSFSAFVRANTRDFPGRERLLETCYEDARSGHVHGGKFLLGEHDSSWPDFGDPDSMKRLELGGDAHRLIREAIVTWTLRTFRAGLSVGPDVL
jgi:hypothetical protein